MTESAAGNNRLTKIDAVDFVFVAVMTVFSVALMVILYWSLFWEVHWDAMWMHRIAYLIFERDYAPYKDVFDPNMFGAYLLHGAIGAVGGYNDLALRVFDLVWLIAMGVCMARVLLYFFDWRCAWFAPVAYAWIYINQEESQCLQREHLILLPMLMALWVACSPAWSGKPIWMRSLVIGALYGVGVSIKPHCVVSLPIIALLNLDAARAGEPLLAWFRLTRFKEFALVTCATAAGLVIPLGLGLAWVAWSGGLDSFITMVREYWPLHRRLTLYNGTLYPIQEVPPLASRVMAFGSFQNFGGREMLFLGLLLAGVSSRHALRKDPLRLAVLTALLLCMASHMAAIAFVGLYHPYSWLPILVFLLLAFSLVFWRGDKERGMVWGLSIVLAAFFAYGYNNIHFNVSTRLQAMGLPPKTYWSEQVDDMMRYLRAHARPGDKVQPFDILGGSDRALTLLGMDNGTFLTSDHFINFHVHAPFMQRIRERFWVELTTNKPRYILAVSQMRLFAADPTDNGAYSRQIGAWIANNYEPKYERDGFVILELRRPVVE